MNHFSSTDLAWLVFKDTPNSPPSGTAVFLPLSTISFPSLFLSYFIFLTLSICRLLSLSLSRLTSALVWLCCTVETEFVMLTPFQRQAKKMMLQTTLRLLFAFTLFFFFYLNTRVRSLASKKEPSWLEFLLQKVTTQTLQQLIFCIHMI